MKQRTPDDIEDAAHLVASIRAYLQDSAESAPAVVVTGGAATGLARVLELLGFLEPLTPRNKDEGLRRVADVRDRLATSDPCALAGVVGGVRVA